MQVGQPSLTAMAVARARAQHQTADDPQVFTDPLAERLVGEAIMGESRFDIDLDAEMIRRRRLLIAARSRFADDVVSAAIGRGVAQVVILGAGLDTTAYRRNGESARFFEVDHPDTQVWKRHRLTEAGIEIPPSLTFAPVDFEQSTLASGLAEASFDHTRPAVYLWLGVVMYLTEPSIDETLRYIAAQGGGAEVVFDYIYPVDTADTAGIEQLRARAERVASVGEPWISFFTVEQITAKLTSFGFTRVEDRTTVSTLASYGASIPELAPGTVPHMMHAATV
ncbi:class I SAM-dependent methyltransferase [Nocardia aurea]|uniref:class I SAM-dependent methyltransferase n=1 Tax=Nocardia aurea TaxID=2144174 RepID=UPI0033AB678C